LDCYWCSVAVCSTTSNLQCYSASILYSERGLWKCCVVGCYCKVGLCSRNTNSDTNANSATHGDNCGKSGQHDVRQSLDRDLVLDQRNFMHGRGRLDGGEGAQRYPDGIAAKYYDLHADVHREQWHLARSQYDGSGECRPGAGRRRVRIGEWHDGIVFTYGRPLLRRYGIVRGGLGPVDMELRRFQRRRQRELLCVGGICIRRRGIYASTRSCRRKLRHAVGR
jgi:hypothetical protein